MRTGDFIVSMLSGHWWVFELGSNMSASCLEKPLSVLCGVEAGRPGRRLSEYLGEVVAWTTQAEERLGVKHLVDYR